MLVRGALDSCIFAPSPHYCLLCFIGNIPDTNECGVLADVASFTGAPILRFDGKSPTLSGSARWGFTSTCGPFSGHIVGWRAI